MNVRLAQYLRKLADRDWGSPSGFGGRTCFQAIPALELERRGERPGGFRREWIDYSLDLIRGRKDCQDFAMAGLLRMLYRFPESQLLSGVRPDIEAALLGAKYDERDPGVDGCCWLTENHQILYASAEYLAGRLFEDRTFGVTGWTGRRHAERGRAKLERWLDWRRRFSFSEWNSSCYYDEDAAPLLNLAEYAEPDLAGKAKDVFGMLLFHVAVNGWKGLTGGSQGRAYIDQETAPGETPMATLSQLAWGDGPVPARLGLAAVLLAAGEVAVPEALRAAGRDLPPELENRERHGLDAEEADAYGLQPDRLEDYPFFAGSGLDHHHLLAETRFRYFEGREKWPNFFADRDYYRRCKANGEAFDPRCLPHALGHADVYTFKTPEYLLGCAQNYRPGTPGYQQWIWSAILGERAVVFTTNPAPDNVPWGRPGPWVGNGVLPKVLQHRNVLVALHRVRPCPIYDQPPWFREDRVHAWFPKGAFDEVVELAGWCFGRKGEGFIGLKPLKPAAWVEPRPEQSARLGLEGEYEWEVRDTDVAWICELGSARTHGSFASFVEKLAAARIEGGVESLVFESPSAGRVETGWERPLVVKGAIVETGPYPRFDNPYCRAPFGAGTINMQTGTGKWTMS